MNDLDAGLKASSTRFQLYPIPALPDSAETEGNEEQEESSESANEAGRTLKLYPVNGLFPQLLKLCPFKDGRGRASE